MDFLKSFTTRWTRILDNSKGYRLLCSNPECSLSCANLRNGKLSVTSIHGDERHSQELTKTDMMFTTLMFLDSLSPSEFNKFLQLFNKMSPTGVLSLEILGKE